MLIDTHCHLDAAEFNGDRDAIAIAALQQGVAAIIVPAVHVANFDAVIQLAQTYPHIHYALGIHPLYVNQSQPQDIHVLSAYLQKNMASKKPPVAMGEIGLDFFVTSNNKAVSNKEAQVYFFTEQLKLAKEFDLPVILHVRSAIDEVLKYCRQYQIKSGIAHAFNGSRQQADAFIKLGFKLGFGGAMTYPRALKIRELAATLPLDAIVLETDAPDIPPVWLVNKSDHLINSSIYNKPRNSPLELAQIAEVFAGLRGLNVAEIGNITAKNTLKVMPKILDLYTPAQVLH